MQELFQLLPILGSAKNLASDGGPVDLAVGAEDHAAPPLPELLLDHRIFIRLADDLIGTDHHATVVGKELRDKALIAFVVAIGAQMVYLAFRFRWTYASAAVVSMMHVVLTVVGVFAWLGKPVNGVFLAAVLSIIGLAVNDTIVVFDRIREGTRNARGNLRETVNAALLQTMPRTLNTGLGAMFILATLAVVGGDSLTDFAVALLLGLLIGIYSTVFTAAPLAIWAEERWPVAPGSDRSREVDPYANVPVAGRRSGPV